MSIVRGLFAQVIKTEQGRVLLDLQGDLVEVRSHARLRAGDRLLLQVQERGRDRIVLRIGGKVEEGLLQQARDLFRAANIGWREEGPWLLQTMMRHGLRLDPNTLRQAVRFFAQVKGEPAAKELFEVFAFLLRRGIVLDKEGAQRWHRHLRDAPGEVSDEAARQAQVGQMSRGHRDLLPLFLFLPFFREMERLRMRVDRKGAGRKKWVILRFSGMLGGEMLQGLVQCSPPSLVVDLFCESRWLRDRLSADRGLLTRRLEARGFDVLGVSVSLMSERSLAMPFLEALAASEVAVSW